MNGIVKKFSLAGDKFMPEMHLRLQTIYKKTKAEYKNLKKQEIYDIFIKMIYVKFAFNMI